VPIIDRWLLFRGHVSNKISNWDPRSPLFGTRKVVVVGRWLLFGDGSYSSGLTVILNLNRFDNKIKKITFQQNGLSYQYKTVSGDSEDDDTEVEDEEGVERARVQSRFTFDSGLQVVDEVLEVVAQVLGDVEAVERVGAVVRVETDPVNGGCE